MQTWIRPSNTPQVESTQLQSDFTNDKNEKEHVLDETMSGGVTFNDCFLHVAAHDAPFGGVGNPEMGCYHGRYEFLAFSHLCTHIDALLAWMEPLAAACCPPCSTEKSLKLSPLGKPPFDRDGNDVPQGRCLQIAAAATVVTAVAYANGQNWV